MTVTTRIKNWFWKAKGSEYENYNSLNLSKAEPKVQSSGPISSEPPHGTLPAGFKPTENTPTDDSKQESEVPPKGPISSEQPPHGTLPAGFKPKSSTPTEDLKQEPNSAIAETEDDDTKTSTIESEIRREKRSTLLLLLHLEDAKIGDQERLKHIKQAINNKKELPDPEKQYIEELNKQLTKAIDRDQVLECKIKVTAILEAVKRLQEIESRHNEKLKSIAQVIENGSLPSQRDIRYLKRRYQKLQQALKRLDKVEWTLGTIEKLLQSRIGDPDKMDVIKELLDDEAPVPDYGIKYLREAYKLLRHAESTVE